MLPENLSYFYRYQGSLTTPPCSESVIWTIFHSPIVLSHTQVSAGPQQLLFPPFLPSGDLGKLSGLLSPRAFGIFPEQLELQVAVTLCHSRVRLCGPRAAD